MKNKKKNLTPQQLQSKIKGDMKLAVENNEAIIKPFLEDYRLLCLRHKMSFQPKLTITNEGISPDFEVVKLSDTQVEDIKKMIEEDEKVISA